MKNFKNLSLGVLLAISVLRVISYFEKNTRKNSAIGQLRVVCLIFNVQKSNLYCLKGHKIIYPRKPLKKTLTNV